MSGAQLKYVRHSTVGFVVWPVQIHGPTHKEVALAMHTGDDAQRGETLSAGFVQWDFDGRPLCMGESVSLGIASREDDTDALRAEWGMTAPAATAHCCHAAGLALDSGEFIPAAELVSRQPLPPSLQAEARAVGAGGDADSLEPSEPAL